MYTAHYSRLPFRAEGDDPINDVESPAERVKRKGVPLIPKRPPADPRANPVVAVCEECGRDVYQVEWYNCPNSRCPLKSIRW